MIKAIILTQLVLEDQEKEIKVKILEDLEDIKTRKEEVEIKKVIEKKIKKVETQEDLKGRKAKIKEIKVEIKIEIKKDNN